MRSLVILIALVACSIPDKQPFTEAGTDAPVDGTGDDRAPQTTITAAPEEFSGEGAATFRFESDDEAATFECSIDRETPVACTPPYTRILGDGSHGFVVRAIDAAGDRDDTPAEHAWSIDTVAPDTILTEAPPAADNSVLVRFSFESREQLVTFECALDGNSYIKCKTGDQFGPVDDGPHSFAVRARDRANNVDASPSIHAWSVDTSTPDTELISGPTGATGTTSASFTFVSPDAGAGATFQCSLDGAAFTPCSSPRNLVGLAIGPHTFAVRVRDAVGNLDPTPATRTWTVDLAAPNTTIVDGPAGLQASASASFTFSSNEQPVTFECRLDYGAFAACSSPVTVLALAQGLHRFSVRATDAAGHTDPSPASRTWSVDTIAPDLMITSGPANGSTSGPRVIFTFTAGDGTVACSLDAVAFVACTSPVAFSLPAGPHQLRVRATDAAGNLATDTRAWTVACSAPTTIGATGLLHLDELDQTVVNAVAGGGGATLGDDLTVEPGDPARVAGRFGGGLAFMAAEVDHVTWPALLGATIELTIELWAQPDSPAGLRVLLASGDGRVGVRATALSPTTVQFSVAIVETGPTAQTRIVTSAPAAAGTWHHVLVSLQEPTLRLWVDGMRTEAIDVRPTTPLALDAIRLGGEAPTAYSGALDEVWLAQTALTADEAALARYCPP